ncbi:hypothetical protein K439DRAFT_687577 [Ramaria rubella]|nr:hypothetical protein K439DRAFT_687577 [Ramaria rubella]
MCISTLQNIVTSRQGNPGTLPHTPKIQHPSTIIPPLRQNQRLGLVIHLLVTNHISEPQTPATTIGCKRLSKTLWVQLCLMLVPRRWNLKSACELVCAKD